LLSLLRFLNVLDLPHPSIEEKEKVSENHSSSVTLYT